VPRAVSLLQLRHSGDSAAGITSVTFGPFRVVPSESLLLRSNQPVNLPSKAFEILLMLLDRSGQLVPKGELIERVSGSVPIGESQLRVYISKLRKALEDSNKGPRYIENINGHGYRFIAPVTRTEELSQPLADGGMNARLPRSVPPPPSRVLAGASFAFGPFELIPDQRLLLRAGKPVNVPSRAWEILLVLIEHAGDLVGKADLLAHVWPRIVVEEGALRVHISLLRRILGDGRDRLRYIDNVTGLGYRFVATVHKRDLGSIGDTDSVTGDVAFKSSPTKPHQSSSAAISWRCRRTLRWLRTGIRIH
jgi:DNA-binding winged helix-turn-helix (wHTH) protein